MAKQSFVTGQVLTAQQVNDLQTNDFNQTVSAKTASYTLVAADKGTRITMSSTSATTITVNTGLFAAGDTLFIQNLNTGVSTITAGTATVDSSASLALAQHEGGTLYFTSAGVSTFFKAAGGGASGGGMTLLQSLSLSGTSTTSSSLSADYKMLQLIFYGVTVPDNDEIAFRVNSNTGSIYYTAQFVWTGNNTPTGQDGDLAGTSLFMCNYITGAGEASGMMTFPNYASTTKKKSGFVFMNSTTSRRNFGSVGINTASAISTFTFFTTDLTPANMSGTVDIYGVN
jgi:hypothetical protein